MSDETPVTPPPVTVANPTGLADGEWHRLHRATPLFRGGIALVAVIGIVIANLRERILGIFMPTEWYDYEGDPIDFIISEGLLLWALIAAVVILVLVVLGFWLSWRMHAFRVTSEVVEVRSGILFRTHRKARLDRVQGINITRPFVPRLFGAAKLEVSQAGQDANVQLAYLTSDHADGLRREILRLASGVQAQNRAQAAGQPQAAAPALPGPASGLQQTSGIVGESAVAEAGEGAVHASPHGFGDLVEQRVHEFIAPELDDELTTPESVVAMPPGRLLGSLLLSAGTIVVVLLVVAIVVMVMITGNFSFVFFLIFPIIGVGTWLVQKFLRSLRYSIAGTPNGIRVGFGLLSTANETLPPGRIHAVQISQSILWRGPGWYDIKINRAGTTSMKGAAGDNNATILPVGRIEDVIRVLELISPDFDPELVRAGLQGTGREDDGFVTSPRRAAWFLLWAWRRNGVAVKEGAVAIRRGRLYRQLVLTDPARAQDVSVSQGPISSLLRVADLQLHSVTGLVSLLASSLDSEDAKKLFEQISADAVSGIAKDRSHRWGAEGAQ